MPMYEYECGGCGKRFEVFQSMHANPEDTVCTHCRAKKATRLLSAFASKIVGDHKPGFAEMKAYGMLNERMEKYRKLPPMMGQRGTPVPSPTTASDSGSTEGTGN